MSSKSGLGELRVTPAGLIKEFQFSGASGLFFVSSFNRSDGTAVISNKEPLDYEAASSHMFFIRAVDMGQPPRVSKPATITGLLIKHGFSCLQYP